MKKLIALLATLALLLSMVSVPVMADGKPAPSICIVVAGTLGDRSFYDSSKEGIDRLAADFGIKTGVIECKEDASQYENALFEAAEQYEVVAAVGWQFWDALADENGVVSAFPEVKFLFIDNGLDGMGDNLMSIVYAQNQGSFLAGYIAAKLSETGKIGAVGGEDSDTINDFLIGYRAGAAYANPDVVVEVQYANDFEDPAKGKECALALYTAGCDIVYQVAGKTGEGVFEAAQVNGKYAIGVDGDQKYINPDVIICSMVKRVGDSIYDVVANMDGMFQPGAIWNADMASGYIDVVYGTDDMPQQVSAELKAEVDELKAKIVSGEIVVPSAFDAQ
ncbi:MAG: BMP family ABC transporter substrate-binding protein [bacterium]|nr:BMP family ABC transporter substrate-binding protein [bacterium]